MSDHHEIVNYDLRGIAARVAELEKVTKFLKPMRKPSKKRVRFTDQDEVMKKLNFKKK